ncbi:MAG: DDE-type integrase/transposase/recombinase [Hymenobacter sp.]
MLDVPPSRYYAWRQRSSRPRGRGSTRGWETALVRRFDHHKRRYGTRRLRAELQRPRPPRGPPAPAHGHAPAAGCAALQPKAYTPRTTDSTHGLRCAPNLLLDQPHPTQANRVWVSDITYLPLASGQWAYLCAFQDVSTQQVVGWQVLATMPEELVTSALQRALLAQPARPWLAGPLGPRGPVLRQRLPRPARTRTVPGARRAAAAECLRQRPGRKPVVAAENRRTRSARVARFPRPGGRAAQRSRLILTTTTTSAATRRSTYHIPQAFYLQQLKNTTLNCPV